MNRRQFVSSGLAMTGAALSANNRGIGAQTRKEDHAEHFSREALSSVRPGEEAAPEPTAVRLRNLRRPLAITMWDFSWLERRWPGAGYEDWDEALGQLVERGYDAVRIDAYPHLVSADPFKTWMILPVWDQMNWGAQSPIQLRVLPALTEFIAKAAAHGIM